MNKKIKYILDAIMTLIMVLLMKINFVGLLWHEILGLGIFLLFVIHNLLNLKYFICVLMKFFSDCVKLRVKIGIVLDLILFVVVTAIIVTGIMISKEIFPFGYVGLVSGLHHSLSYLSLILISIHLGLHWSSILEAFRKMFRLKKLNRARTYALRIVTLLIVFFGIKGSFNQNIGDGLLEFKNIDEGKDIFEKKTHKSSRRNNEESDKTEDQTTSQENLEDYLSKLYCNGCSRHCPLSSPRCSIGEKEAIEATSLFYQDKAVAEDNNTDYLGPVFRDFIPMMGLYIAGTHYLVMIPKYQRNRNQ